MIGRPVRDRLSLKRAGLLAAGWLSLGAGIVGVFVPVWPTTCFVLLSAACFSRSSPRIYRQLTRNRFVGRHIREYRERGTVDPRICAASLIVLWTSLAATIAIAGPGPGLTVALLLVGTLVTIHLRKLAARSAPGGASPMRPGPVPRFGSAHGRHG